MDDLVQRLSTGEHKVEAGLRPERTVKELKAAIDRGYVHVKFTETRGGTELGFKLEDGETDLSAADFDVEKGKVRLGGKLVLNYEPVRCVAEIDLESLAGTGHLIVLPKEED